jgi:hypothetical protein
VEAVKATLSGAPSKDLLDILANRVAKGTFTDEQIKAELLKLDMREKKPTGAKRQDQGKTGASKSGHKK